jgi:hypothetical protein
MSSKKPPAKAETKPYYLPMKEKGMLWWKRKVPDGWEDLGESGAFFSKGWGQCRAICPNGCSDRYGSSQTSHLARLNTDEGERVLMYCPVCRMVRDFPDVDDPSDCNHKWGPIVAHETGSLRYPNTWKTRTCEKCAFRQEL